MEFDHKVKGHIFGLLFYPGFKHKYDTMTSQSEIRVWHSKAPLNPCHGASSQHLKRKLHRQHKHSPGAQSASVTIVQRFFTDISVGSKQKHKMHLSVSSLFWEAAYQNELTSELEARDLDCNSSYATDCLQNSSKVISEFGVPVSSSVNMGDATCLIIKL